jgi:hypothetical protein
MLTGASLFVHKFLLILQLTVPTRGRGTVRTHSYLVLSRLTTDIVSMARSGVGSLCFGMASST